MNRRRFLLSSTAAISIMITPSFCWTAAAALSTKHEVRACWLKRAATQPNFKSFSDKRIHGMIAKSFPAFSSSTQFAAGRKLYPLISRFTTAPGDAPKVDHDRFVSLYGRTAHFEAQRAFLWVDTHPSHNGTNPLMILAFQAYEKDGASHPSQRRIYVLPSDPDIYATPAGLPHNFRLTAARWVRQGHRKYYGGVDEVAMLHPTQAITNPVSPDVLSIASRYLI